MYSRPAYQNTVAGVVGAHRGVPDVAWNAAVNGGVLVYHSYFPSIEGPPAWGVYGGTSASSPQAAALTAIGNQARKAAGKAPDRQPEQGDLQRLVRQGRRLQRHRAARLRHHAERVPGQQPDLGHRGRRVRHPDPVPGYPTTAGYDLTTGWGGPQGGAWTTLVLSKP